MDEDQRKETRRGTDLILHKIVEILRVLEMISRGEDADFTEAYADLVGMRDQLGKRSEDRELGETLCRTIEAIAVQLDRALHARERSPEGRPRKISLAGILAHPLMAETLTRLSMLYAAVGEFEDAHDLLKRAQEIDNKVMDHITVSPSQVERIKFVSARGRDMDVFLSLVVQHLTKSPSARRDALDVWLKRKGRILETQRPFEEVWIRSNDPQTASSFQEYASVAAQLSRLVFAGPGKEGSYAHRKKIESLETRKGTLEARLSAQNEVFALGHKIGAADTEKVAGALPANTVLLEFARTGMYNFKAEDKDIGFRPAHYLAFMLPAGGEDKVDVVDLGDAERIDRAVAGLKAGIEKTDDSKKTLAMESSRLIHDLVFAPLREKLGDVREVFISPDGHLNLISFEVLQGPEGRYLIEDYTFNYLIAGRDVLGFGRDKGHPGKALLMGDPDFDMSAEERADVLRRLAVSAEAEPRSYRLASDMQGFHFSRIPGTREEVRAVRDIIGAEHSDLYIGREALEEVLGRSESPGILHLATSGFFLSDLDLENPWLHSGIALAGANDSLRSGDEDETGGIVTAEKILGLNLRGTDLVVLSACASGICDVKAVQAVFALRRSFNRAGAKSLVMGMWSMPDREATELMVEFYRNYLSGNMSGCQALRQAALMEMETVRKRYGHPDPRLWGAFVFVGQPGGIERLA
jgi:CHAT domain-containing protein